MSADGCPSTSPVSLRVNVRRLPRGGMPVVIEADAAARAALAAAHGLVSVERFRAEMAVRPWRAGGVQVSGRLLAAVTQTCVVTLEPLAAALDEEVLATFVPEGPRPAGGDTAGGALVVGVEGPDKPETFPGDAIDVGALAEEFLALAIDPYPRRPGAVLDMAAPDPAAAPAGPLSEALRKLGQKS